MLTKKRHTILTVETRLAHFAIVTYMVEPDALRRQIHERFEPYCISLPDGTRKALISVVPFLDRDFHFVRCPWPKFTFGQTNYRAYVTDTITGEHVAWFLGTSLASIFTAVPHFAWRLPWRYADIRFDTHYDEKARRYDTYRMATKSKWAPAQLELDDSGNAPKSLRGFSRLQTGLVLLTHPLRGYYYRRDGKLGSYSIWHEMLKPTEGRALSASFPLLQRLGLTEDGDLSTVHSVLIQNSIDFTIYLPPTVE